MGADAFTTARRKMIEGQLVPANVIDGDVIDALAGLPREQFVPEELKGAAYVDEDLEVAPGRSLIAPLVLARLLVLAEIKKTDRVLDIGAATGYSTAVLAQLAEHVVAIESNPELAEAARKRLSRLHLPNTEFVTGGLSAGHPSGAPYDVVLLNGAVDVIPQALVDQVAEGGRVVGVQNVVYLPGTRAGLGKATVWRKQAGALQPQIAFDASVPPLVEFAAKEEFVF
ncbi:MAG: protein-L-isoaspartate O-methyltransferase [Alphaproteobacteria bacterium]|nr:protein-L-isoaspartate O-methyltransferase [Alphaproteobacteria bacterium]